MESKPDFLNRLCGKCFCTIMTVISLSFSLQAATSIPEGDVSGTWDLASSPYLIGGDITVPAGAALAIEAGVVVEFQSWYGLTVNGSVQAVGTVSQPIVFTATPPGPGEPAWPGINIVNAPVDSRFEYCIVENGQSRAAAPNDRGGAFYILNSSPVISHCTLRNNNVSRYGAAIYCDAGSPLIEGCTITGNQAGSSTTAAGGALYFTNGSQPQILANAISHNHVGAYGGYSAANGLGGAIYLNHSDAIIRDNTITYNTVHAEGNVPTHARGGAVYIQYSDPLLTGNTLYGNEVTVYSSPGEGGSLYVYGSDPQVVNGILWNNSPQEVFFSSSGTSSILFAYSDVEGGETGIVTNGQGTAYWQDGNIDGDPLFTDAGGDDFSLQSGSPAIDAGTAHFEWQGNVLIDLDDSQYLGTAPDMGALESEYTQPVNQPPIADASASPLSGPAPLSVQFNSDLSYDPDGTITGYEWSWGGLSTANPNPSYTFNDPGTYAVNLTVTDNDGATGSDQVIIQVSEPALMALHVGGQNLVRQRYKGRIYRAVDRVLILDQDNQPTAGANVTAIYSGPSAGTASGITDSDGGVYFTTNWVRKPVGEWCFEVISVSKASYGYDPDANVVTVQCEGSSSGTLKSLDTRENGVSSFGESDHRETGLTVYPNPFNVETMISIMLEEEQVVNLKIYSITGALVRSLVTVRKLPAGIHNFRWEGKNDTGQLLAPGIYYLRFDTPDNHQTRALLINK